jgi:hypothetical protein
VLVCCAVTAAPAESTAEPAPLHAASARIERMGIARSKFAACIIGVIADSYFFAFNAERD